MLTAARAEALFTSVVRTGTRLGRDEATAAIRIAVHRNGGLRGCAAEMAFAFGDHPEAAAERMRWARRCVLDAYRTEPTAPGRVR
jgi:hypothetical protein